MPAAALNSAERRGAMQEAEEEDSEAARVAQLKGMSKLIHKMSNSISARRPQCFGGQPGLPGPTDGKQVRSTAVTLRIDLLFVLRPRVGHSRTSHAMLSQFEAVCGAWATASLYRVPLLTLTLQIGL